MDESENKQGQPKKELRCDPKQLELLKNCSDEKDLTKWNKWREENPDEEIWLEGAGLIDDYLKGVDLQFAHLKGAYLHKTHLEGAYLTEAHLEGADLPFAHLERADLVFAHLEGANLRFAHLERARFAVSVVDGSTLLSGCTIDRKTDFRGVGLESCCIDEPTKYLLEYNIRRMNCEDWYKQHPQLAWPVKVFFWISDYGRSTRRIIFAFFSLAFIFANIYYHWGRIAPPGIVGNLFVDGNGVIVSRWLVPLRTLYFSIVTMTTLGFGDMFANSQSIWGYILLMLQVLLGYCLLGTLITRFAVLFKSGVIPGEFQEKQKEA
jgi:hypothetical protein